MGFGTNRGNSFSLNNHRPLPPNTWQRIFGGIGLVCFAALGAWAICCDVSGTDDDRIELASTRGDKLVTAEPSVRVSSVHNYLHLSNAFSVLDPHPSLGFPPASFAMNAPPPRDEGEQAPASSPSQIAGGAAADSPPKPLPDSHLAQAVNLPVPRPHLRPVVRVSASDSAHAGDSVAEKPPEQPSFFEKLFGKPASFTLAYAAPDVGGLGGGQSIAASRYDRWTAVYDISAHTVYMPDGTQLEAHSGLGDKLDNPRYADEKMRGVTPPNVYDLEPRESLFHGVRALRLIPEDEQKTMGRAGLLAHSFMLGPNGDSNGCVSFRDYEAFLKAYLDHKIKRLAVVARLE
jgi:Tlde1 domain